MSVKYLISARNGTKATNMAASILGRGAMAARCERHAGSGSGALIGPTRGVMSTFGVIWEPARLFWGAPTYPPRLVQPRPRAPIAPRLSIGLLVPAASFAGE